jgi:zinc and cadmium transporter
MGTFLWILAATLLDGIIGLIGIFSLAVNRKFFNSLIGILVAFSAGALLSGALFHLLAESLEKLSAMWSFIFLMIGFVIFFVVERFLHWHHCHEGECEVHPYSYLILFGDSVHNIIDGFVIAASFLVSVPFGIITTVLIIGHEIPQELGNFAILVHGGFSRAKSLLYNFFAQLTCVLGGIIGFVLSGVVDKLTTFMLPFAAGGFIYIAASDLIPELHKEPKLSKSMVSFAMFIFGIVFMFAMKILLEH